jgi:ABC-2 type transport system permease protein
MSAIGTTPAAGLERRLPGPTTIGQGWRRTREIVWVSAVADFQQRYAGSRLGYLWTLLKPILLFGILYVVVTEIFQRFTDVPFYGPCLLFAIMIYTFYSEAVGGSVRSLATGGLLRKVEMPVIALPFSTNLSSAFSFATNLLVVTVWILLAGVDPTWEWLLLPVVLVWLFALTIGSSLLISALWVRHRDVGQAWPSISRLLFYATPIIYPIEAIPEGAINDLASLNPLAPIVAEARVWMIDPDAPGWFDDRALIPSLLPFLVGGAICVAGVLLFKARARTAAEQI